MPFLAPLITRRGVLTVTCSKLRLFEIAILSPGFAASTAAWIVGYFCGTLRTASAALELTTSSARALAHIPSAARFAPRELD